MRKINQQEFLDKISEVAFMIEKEKQLLIENLYKTHPAAKYFFESLKSLSFHEPTENIFDKLLTSAENAILAFYLLAKQNPLIKSVSIEQYENALNKNKEDFSNIAESDKLNKPMIENFLLKSLQPAVYTLLYVTFPKVAENDWDKSIAFLIFLRVKSFIDCLCQSY
ncbi:MAG: hypothetical protein WH035_06070 [Spirochaetota bacterium]